jgi:Flp pilus assembly protein TadG
MNSLFRRLYHDQEGQALYMVAALLVALLGMAAISIDIGYALHSQRELQATTDAAAAAGGAAMGNQTLTSASTNDVKSVVVQYSGQTSTEYNYHHDLDVTGLTVGVSCLSTTTYPNYSLPPCATSPAGSYTTCSGTTGGCNAIQVTETASVPTFFAKIFGIKSISISATSVASASGGGAIPYHIMMVLDTTASMGTTNDTGCLSNNPSGTYTAEQCAQFGVQVLLSDLSPCAPGTTCGGSSTPVDQVGIMVFPGLCSDTATKVTTTNCPNATTLTNTTANATYAPPDYSCPSTSPPIAAYNNDPEYLLLGFQDNYRTNDNAALNTSSDLAQAVGGGTWISGGGNTCGLQDPGGEGTFYAGAIVAAQQYLTANHTSGIQDVMILLSDGDANSSSTQMGGTVKETVSNSNIAGMNGNLFASTAECTQAVNAANWAKGVKQSDNTSTLIYAVSYGSENSGCTDGNENVPALGGNGANTPCATMAGIASQPLSEYFFSVPQTVKGVTSTTCKDAVPITKLDQVFNAIGGELETSRLIPGNVTGTWSTLTD